MISWFETRAGERKRCREDALLTMRVSDLILRSIANGSRECAPDDRLRDVRVFALSIPHVAPLMRAPCRVVIILLPAVMIIEPKGEARGSRS